MTPQKSPKFTLLAILDGWGIAPEGEGNAIELAQTPNMDDFWANYPSTKLKASGQAVGLPRGEDGNTETGHLNIGAGRIVYQDLEKINMSIAEGDFFTNKAFLKAIEHVKQNNSDLHYMGLVGAGGVHSDLSHLFALVNLASEHDIENLYIHVFTDGRDSPPTSAATYIGKLQNFLKKKGIGEIASVIGRYWAMDRDMRWKRTERAYKTLIEGSAVEFDDVFDAINASYDNGMTDEFIEPITITSDGKPKGLIKDNDAVIFYNFRTDRPRQLTKAFVMDDFSKSGSKQDFDPYRIRYEKRHHPEEKEYSKPFERGRKLENLFFVTMTEYSKQLAKEGVIPAYPPEIVQNTLGEVLAKNNKRQLRITESEKEKFVTYYFSGLQEEKFDEEERIIIPSPNVATYDLKPEMSADEMTQRLLKELEKNKFDFVVLNYPNPDMVGHSGDLQATIKAVEVVDQHLGELYDFVQKNDGCLLVTGDHGNAEELLNPDTDEKNTEHSSNLVPFIYIDNRYKGNNTELQEGILADIAPTVLSLLGLPKPEEMTGRNLLHSLIK